MEEIDNVLLDLDGTLLDRHFDDFFWQNLVPEKYAKRHGIPVDDAKEHLFNTYRKYEGTLKWTDLDYWSRELSLDIPALKGHLRHLINVHPYAEKFLIEMRRQDKKIHLFTNAHYKSVDLKFEKTGIGKYFDSVVTSNGIGSPKENQEFWHRAQSLTGFDKERAIFVDDTEEVLRAARIYGIRHVVLKGRASSREEVRNSKEFPSITDFDDLMPHVHDRQV
jgi:putative hydrolase of the HAD superfamily